jgi:glycosidase
LVIAVIGLKKVIAGAVIFSCGVGPTFAATDYSSLSKPVFRTAQSDESIYFIMTDRFENGDSSNDFGSLVQGDSASGYAPADIGGWHGGDFKGITRRLDYIKSMGFTSIWITPPVKQKFVQGDSAAYHGYWGLDFTTVDPHLGSEEDLHTLIKEAHALNIKVIFDVVTNHTADVIYLENGKPAVTVSEANSKKPDWLNKLSNYNNLGNSPAVENAIEVSDFFGLDDLNTKKPEVIEGWIKLWSDWITEFKFDGMRIDTFKHVDAAFWKQFIPKIHSVAKQSGIDEFIIFGEVADPDALTLASYVVDKQTPGILDFAFQKKIIPYAQYGLDVEQLAELFNQDDYYTTPYSNAGSLVTFLGNHDMGRIGRFLSNGYSESESDKVLDRSKLAQALLFYLRGTPVVYYGDERGMVGSGGDKKSRQSMFATQVEEWKSEARIGSQAVGDGSSFEGSHPLQEQITQIQEIIAAHPGLRAGSQEVLIASGGLFIVNRTLASKNYLVGFNGRDADQSIDLNSLGIKQGWRLLDGGCSIDATDSTRCNLSGRSYFVIENGTSAVNTPALANLKVNAKRTSLPTGWIEISTRVPGKDFVEVSFSVRSPGKAWRHLGTSDRRTFSTDKTRGGLHRVFLHPEKFKKGSTLEIIAVVKSGDNKIKASAISKVKL